MMKYTYPYEEYLNQLREYNKIEKTDFSSCKNKNELIQKLEERSLKKKAIADISNTIIREYIETFEKNPNLLSKEDADLLQAFYAKIIAPSSDDTSDSGLLLRISKVLKDYYKEKDRAQYISKLKTCVVYERILLYNHSNVYYESPFLDECLEVAKDIDNLSEEEKASLIFTFYWLVIYHEDDFHRTNDIHPVDRILEIDNYLKNLLKVDDPMLCPKVNSLSIASNMLNIICEFSMWSSRHHLSVDLPKYRDFIKRCYAIMKKALDDKTITGAPSILSAKGTLLHVDYILRNITCEELLEKISEFQQYDESEPTVLKVMKLAKFNFQYLTYLIRYSGFDHETITRISQERINEVLPKIKTYTEKENNPTLNLFLLFFIVGVSYTADFKEFSQTILDLTVYSDKALYVHTEMVKELSAVIYDNLVTTNPEFFDGVADKDFNYIKNHKKEMRELLMECCRFHDVGKFFMIDVVENSFRNLTNEEFEIIKYHPVAFKDFVENGANQDPNIKCIFDCMTEHHLWHDGSKGYPRVKHTNNRSFVDVLAIADSIDAATDVYGRPYRATKTLDQLIEEIKKESGTRYSEVVANSLDNPLVKEKLQYLISEGRKDIYFKVYINSENLKK